MTRSVTHSVTVSDPIKLSDLRWLIKQCDGFSDDSPVSVTARTQYDQRDYDPATITVNGKAESQP